MTAPDTKDQSFTPDQIRDYKAYERVRKSGRYNMFDPRARTAAELGSERYSFVMKNFAALRTASETK